jgi:hypothetical protein
MNISNILHVSMFQTFVVLQMNKIKDYFVHIQGRHGQKLSVWLKNLGTTEKNFFILIILVKHQTIYEITTNKTCISK